MYHIIQLSSWQQTVRKLLQQMHSIPKLLTQYQIGTTPSLPPSYPHQARPHAFPASCSIVSHRRALSSCLYSSNLDIVMALISFQFKSCSNRSVGKGTFLHCLLGFNDRQTDRPTDYPTNQPKDRHGGSQGSYTAIKQAFLLRNGSFCISCLFQFLALTQLKGEVPVSHVSLVSFPFRFIAIMAWSQMRSNSKQLNCSHAYL